MWVQNLVAIHPEGKKKMLVGLQGVSNCATEMLDMFESDMNYKGFSTNGA